MRARVADLCGAIFGLFIAAVVWTQAASATPSTHVWSPSTDIQASGTIHITADMYVPTERDAAGDRPNTVTNLGLEAGLWPVKDILGVEFGFDHVAGYGELDDYPFYFNAKAGIPEKAFGEYSPALAVGGYNFGTEENKTDVNIYYVKGAKTLSVGDYSLGRFSVGWFWGDDELLIDQDLEADDNGVLLAWERTLSEISDKLWICVDYQGTESGVGALAPGFSWKFADNTALLLGYVIPENDDLAETFTVQVDIDMSLLP